MKPPTPIRSAPAAPGAEQHVDPTPAPTGRKVFDLDAAVADALQDAFPFTYGGPEDDPYEWSMSHPGAVDYRDLEAADSGQTEMVRRVLALAMGAEVRTRALDDEHVVEVFVGEQWEAFDALRMPAVGLDRLFRAWLDHYGIKPGELSGSVAPSASMAAPSNRASRRAAARNSGC